MIFKKEIIYINLQTFKARSGSAVPSWNIILSFSKLFVRKTGFGMPSMQKSIVSSKSTKLILCQSKKLNLKIY